MRTKHIRYYFVSIEQFCKLTIEELRNCRIYLLTLFFLAFGYGYASGQNTWEPVQTVEAVCQKYPERMDLLLRSLNLNAGGLSPVKEAFDQGNIPMACRHLLEYYRKGVTAQFLRRDLPAVSLDINTEADSIVQHIFTFYNQADKVPLDSAGHLNWAYRGPADDIEWAWALNRHHHLGTLLESWFQTGNPKYAKTIDRHLQDWVISSLPYPGVKSSTAMWRGLEVSLRVEVWAQIFFGLITSEYFTPATQLLMLSSLPEHTHYMQHFHAKDGNWLTMEMSGLAMVATAWPEFKDAPAWMAYAKGNMIEGLKDQVYPDGVQKELTSHYHQVALNNFNQFREICLRAKEPLPEFYNAYLENMQDYIAYSVKPDGYGVLNNDSDRQYNRERIKKAASEYNREDWLFIASNGKNGKRPPGAPSRVFPWAGQVISRSGYEPDAQWSFFDIGPWGTGHQHSDKLHISVSAYGRDLLVDAGRFAYRGKVADKFRKYARGSEGHNLILIDGQGQGPGPREVTEPLPDDHYKITERFDYASNSFDQFEGLEGEGKHTRALFYVRGKFWVVVDRIDTDRPRKIETLWHWHPDCKVKAGDDHIVSTENPKGNLEIIPVGDINWNVRQVKGQEKPSPQGWYSEQYNDVEPNTASIFSAEIKTDTSFAWILYPSEGPSPKIETRILSRSTDRVVVRVKDETGDQWDITVPFSNSAKAACTFTSSGEERIQPGHRGLGDLQGATKLLSRLNTDAPGLEKVKASLHDPSAAMDELLAWYRSRESVKHPIDRTTKAAMTGNSADEKDLLVAEDALKHIFVGQGAYPRFFCGDDINWASRPVPDNEWVWQLNRMPFWDAMGKAYWHTGDEKYAREWCLQLLDWTQKNPRDSLHDYAWRSIEAGIRGYQWTGHFQRFIDSPSFTPDVLVAFLNSCYDHASYLMTKYRKGSNWALMEAEGLAFIALTFPEFSDSKTWREEAIARLNKEIENQVYPDGHQRELSIGYHTGSIGWFMRTLNMATMNGLKAAFPASYLQTIEKMCEVPLKLGLPDGTSTQFGDSWAGAPGKNWPMFRSWAEVFSRDDFLYVATEGKEGTEPKATAFALENSGFYSMRSSWDKNAVCLVLKCGPDGGGHCQPDNGTFELYAGGRNLMPDAGSYIYSGDPENRAWFRQTKVHQTLTLNGANSRYAPRLLLWKLGKDLDVLVVENASYENLTHRRAVFFVDKKFFVVVDDALGKGTGDVDLHFQLAPGAAVFDSTKFAVHTDFTGGWNVFVQSMDQKGMRLEEEEGQVSFVYTKKEPRPAFRYRVRKESGEGVRFITVVVPYGDGTPPDIKAKIIGNPKIGANRVKLKIVSAGNSRTVSCKW